MEVLHHAQLCSGAGLWENRILAMVLFAKAGGLLIAGALVPSGGVVGESKRAVRDRCVRFTVAQGSSL